MAPRRSLRTTFSQTSGAAWTLPASSLSRDSPPACVRGLWHVTQYCAMTAVYGDESDGFCGRVWRPAARGAIDVIVTTNHVDTAMRQQTLFMCSERVGAYCRA